MELSILGVSTRNVERLNDWLRLKNCQPYAEHYKRAGEEYGVRWDVAIFQSCLETNFWKFGNDVQSSQNNFAGLGATGGVPGDSFPTPAMGIRAQIQDLALRCGVRIRREDCLSAYVRAQYTTISNRNSNNWSDLAGTWAADKQYWNKIQSIMHDFDEWNTTQGGTKMPAKTIDESISWLELNRTNDGKPAVTAYAGSEPKYTRFIASIEDFIAFRNFFPNAHSMLVAETDKKIIPKCADFGKATPEPVKPEPAKPSRIDVALDSGHSLKVPGAHSNSGKVREEYLNEEAIRVMKAILDENKIGNTWCNPEQDDLKEIGRSGWGTPKIMISWHHNSYEGKGNPYICCMVDPDAPNETKLFAQKCARAIHAAMDGLPQETQIFSGTNGMEGVYEAELSVINTSAKDPDGKPPIHVLVETYFVNKFDDEASCMEATRRAARAVAQLTIDQLKNM